MSETREQRQEKVDARVAALRSKAAKLREQSDRISSTVNDDPAFWTQPAYGNAAGRAFSRRRERERGKLIRAAAIASDADALEARAASLEERGAVMLGDAASADRARAEACNVSVGQTVDTTFYGLRKVIKVNRLSVLVEGSSPLKVEKRFIRADVGSGLSTARQGGG